ncbi:hypothetical protein ACGC1H_005776 [Rhizoctonia solani]
MAPTSLKHKINASDETEITSDEESIESGPEDSTAGGNILDDAVQESDSDGTLDDDFESDDAPEAESLSRGRAAADARAGELKRHEEKLKELRRIKNEAREEFIRSTKPSKLPAAEGKESGIVSGDVGGESDESDGVEEEVAKEASRPGRLPDSVFTAAHESVQESIERKRTKKQPRKDISAKRRRVRMTPAERVVNGRTLRVAADISAPPAIYSTSARKAKSPAKGGSTFRRKWKKVDAMRAQVRSRTGPSRNFVTVVQ